MPRRFLPPPLMTRGTPAHHLFAASCAHARAEKARFNIDSCHTPTLAQFPVCSMPARPFPLIPCRNAQNAAPAGARERQGRGCRRAPTLRTSHRRSARSAKKTAATAAHLAPGDFGVCGAGTPAPVSILGNRIRMDRTLPPGLIRHARPSNPANQKPPRHVPPLTKPAAARSRHFAPSGRQSHTASPQPANARISRRLHSTALRPAPPNDITRCRPTKR